MLFPTVEFALFFVVVLTGSWLLMRQRTAWKLFMVVASYVFYGAWDVRYTLLLAGTTVVNQLVVRAMGRATDDRSRRLFLGLGVAATPRQERERQRARESQRGVYFE